MSSCAGLTRASIKVIHAKRMDRRVRPGDDDRTQPHGVVMVRPSTSVARPAMRAPNTGLGMAAHIVAWTRDHPAAAAAALVALGGAATLIGAWIFQYGFGYPPCPLCLDQRIPYYVAIPLGALVAAVAVRGAPRLQRWVVTGGLAVLALAMLIGAALAIYHAGIEWKWWAGPQDCSGPLDPLGSGDLLRRLQTINIVRCDEAPWRFLGLSLAGYNVLISLALAAVAIWGIIAQQRRGELASLR